MRSGAQDSLTVLPYDETDVLKWNSDPFQLDGGSGYSETDPSSVYNLLQKI